MRPLNRPMFRYGGPIKEGIMSGIREPHAGGGRIGFKDGPKKKSYNWFETPVGSIFDPKQIALGGKKMIAGAYDLGGVPLNALSRMALGYNPGFSGAKFMGIKPDKPDTSYWMGMPTSTKKGWTIPSMKEGPTAAEIELAKLKKQIADQKKGTVPENLVPDGRTDDEIRAEKIQKYRDIMDIKGMNSEAASKSLIEASRLINESQDFKGDIRSGKLINRIIQGASKAYDKPADMRRAIDTLIVKSEIEKDLNKEKNKLDNEYKRSMIAKNEAVLAQDSLAGDLRAYATENQALPSGNTLAAFATGRGYDIKGVEDTTEVKNWMTKNGGNEVAYLQDIITKTEVAPGLYVINNKILAVDESKKITPVI